MAESKTVVKLCFQPLSNLQHMLRHLQPCVNRGDPCHQRMGVVLSISRYVAIQDDNDWLPFPEKQHTARKSDVAEPEPVPMT